MKAVLLVREDACEKLHGELEKLGCDICEHGPTSITIKGNPGAIRTAVRLSGVMKSTLIEEDAEEPVASSQEPSQPDAPVAPSQPESNEGATSPDTDASPSALEGDAPAAPTAPTV